MNIEKARWAAIYAETRTGEHGSASTPLNHPSDRCPIIGGEPAPPVVENLSGFGVQDGGDEASVCSNNEDNDQYPYPAGHERQRHVAATNGDICSFQLPAPGDEFSPQESPSASGPFEMQTTTSQSTMKPLADLSRSVPPRPEDSPVGSRKSGGAAGSDAAASSRSQRGQSLPLSGCSSTSPVQRISADVDSVLESKYLAHWHDGVRPLLPAVFGEIDSLIQRYEVVKLSVLALAASHLGRFHDLQTPSHTELTWPTGSSNHSSDSCNGLSYYSTALKTLASDRLYSHTQLEPCAEMTVLLLVAYFELETGSVSGCIWHLQRVDKLVQSSLKALADSEFGVRLLVAWSGLRAQQVADVCPYGTLTFAHLHSGTIIQAEIDKYIRLTGSTYEFLAHQLARVCITSGLLLLLRTVGKDSANPLYRKWINVSRQVGVNEPPPSLLATWDSRKLLMELDSVGTLLDQWHSSLPLSNLPLESFSSGDFTDPRASLPGLRVRPLCFTTHAAAVDYARYACAQMYASRSSLDRCTGSLDSAEIDPWAHIVLRIVAGIDIAQCFADNVYRHGICWLLTRVALRCCSLEGLMWIDDWFSRAKATGAVAEAGVGLHVLQQLTRTLIEQWENGKFVYLMFSTLGPLTERRNLCMDSRDTRKIQAVIQGRHVDSRGNRKEHDSLAGGQSILFVDALHKFAVT